MIDGYRTVKEIADKLRSEQANLANVAGRCCSCNEVLLFGGHWGQHKEGYRVGPFCSGCSDKPSIEHAVDDPSIGASYTRYEGEAA